jgi:membrane associated rhomboid family serine protease
MWEDIKRSWSNGGMLYRLIWVNVVAFIIVNATIILTKLGSVELSVGINDGFGLATTSNTAKLLSRPWSVVTHMFVHIDVFHLLINMILLWWMGQIYHAEVGSRRLLSTYLMGGFAGFLVYFFAFNFLPGLQNVLPEDTVSYALGASAAVMSIFTATATLTPNRKIRVFLFGSVELKYIAMAYVLFDYFGISQGDGVDAGGKIAHLGGALFGYLLITLDKRGINLVRFLESIIDLIMSILPTKSKSFRGNKGGRSTGKANLKFWRNLNFRKKPLPKTRSNSTKSDEQFNLEKKDREKRLDVILDKISRHGYDHLTKEEKRFLFTESKKD